MALLEAKDLTISYRTRAGGVAAVRSVGFGVERGEFVSLVGGSGSGKSTVALSVARLTDYLPCEAKGNMFFDGQDVFAMQADELRTLRREKIGYVFQDPSASLDPVMRVGDQICEAMPSPSKEGAVQLLESVQIREPDRVFGSFPHQLSGGMKQRAGIAAALAKNPALLVADEPTTALDALVQKEILLLLKNLRGARGLTVLFVTHDLNVARAMSDRILVMQDGRIVDSQTKAGGFRFTHPYAAKLAGAASAGERPKTFFEV